jgi:hypothetical protein
MVARPLGRAPHPFLAYPQARACNYRKSYRYLTKGMPCKVIAVFAESSLQSDRGRPCKVIVDKVIRPKGL